jgi:hypothetical protein
MPHGISGLGSDNENAGSAEGLTFTPSGSVVETNVQAAIAGVATRAAPMDRTRDRYAPTDAATPGNTGASVTVNVANTSDVELTVNANAPTINLTGFDTESHYVTLWLTNDASTRTAPTLQVGGVGVTWLDGQSWVWDPAPGALNIVVIRSLNAVVRAISDDYIKVATFSHPGSLDTNKVGTPLVFRFPTRWLGFWLVAHVAPTGAAGIVDMKYGTVLGTIAGSMFTTPTQMASGSRSSGIIVPTVTSLPAGGWIMPVTTQKGTTVAGAQVTILGYFLGKL